MSKILEALKQMPVYPDGVKLGRSKKYINFGSDVPICESDDGFYSWISQKAKDEYLRLAENSQPHTNRRSR